MMNKPLSVFACREPWRHARPVMVAAMLLVNVTACWAAEGQDSAPSAATTKQPATAAASASAPVIANGGQTRAWLGQQAGHQQTSKTRQTLSGPVMSKVHERYVNSFAQPIPASVRDTSSISNR